MGIPDRSLTLRLYAEGVDAVELIAGGLDDPDWRRPACGHWTAEQLARHLVQVATWYHEWLDRAEAGDSARPFRAAELDSRNEQGVEAASDIRGTDAAREFTSLARSYANRLTPSVWDLPYGYPFGTATAGLHAGAAATEWHLHAWDMSQVLGNPHRPSDAANLWRGVGWCRARSRGSIVGRFQGLLVEVGAAAGDPWARLLEASGRKPSGS